MTLQDRIINILEEKALDYEVRDHAPVYTNPAMAEALDVTEGETVKSLVLSTKEGEMIVMVLPGDKKVDWKKVAAAAGSKKVSFAKPEAVLEAVGCEVGCVPPFGHSTPLAVYMDPALTRLPHVYFNPGVHDKSFRVRGQDLVLLCDPVYVD